MHRLQHLKGHKILLKIRFSSVAYHEHMLEELRVGDMHSMLSMLSTPQNYLS